MQNEGNNITIAYVLWFFLGMVGAHRFYLGKQATAIAQLSLTVFGWLTMILFVGFIFLFIVGTWVFVDLFLIHKYINEQNNESRERKAIHLINQRPVAE